MAQSSKSVHKSLQYNRLNADRKEEIKEAYRNGEITYREIVDQYVPVNISFVGSFFNSMLPKFTGTKVMYIHGKSGVGKTTTLHSAAHFLNKQVFETNNSVWMKSYAGQEILALDEFHDQPSIMAKILSLLYPHDAASDAPILAFEKMIILARSPPEMLFQQIQKKKPWEWDIFSKSLEVFPYAGDSQIVLQYRIFNDIVNYFLE